MNIWALIFTTMFYFLEMSVYWKTINWIYKLEETKCECSDLFHRKYIKKWIQIYIVIMTIVYIYNVYSILILTSGDVGISNALSSFAFQIPLTILSLVNVIVSIHYIDKLKENACVCSKSLARETYYIFSWLKVILMSFFGFLILIITFGITYNIIANKQVSWWFSYNNSKIEISKNDKNN